MKYKKQIVISICLIIAIAFFYIFFGKNILVNYFLKQANNTNLSEKYYNYILAIDSDNSDVRNLLIDFYFESDMYEQASNAVNDAIFADKTNKYAYQQKVRLLAERGEIATAVKIEQAIDDMLYVEFISKSGEYFEPIVVEISASKSSKVYYKINANNYVLYTSPIEIIDGYHDIYAVAISDDGSISRVVSSEFKVTNLTAPVSFSDVVIEVEVNKQIGYFEQNNIVADQLREVKSLDLSKNIVYDDDIVTISNCINLEKLILGDVGNLTSLAPLIKLPKLSEITIERGCSSKLFSDVACIPSLDYIKVLNSNIYEISPAKCMPSTLILSNCLINDVFNLAGYKNLKILDLSNNIISDIYGIGQLKSLDEINLSNNKISDISYLSEIISLKKINLSFNEISDVSVLSRLVFSEEINISNNNVASVSVFSNMRYLEVLNCSYNNILTLEPLMKSESIKEIHANNNSITDLSYIDAFAVLDYLNIENNNLISY